jgi:inhibitor of cysteine peptidase
MNIYRHLAKSLAALLLPVVLSAGAHAVPSCPNEETMPAMQVKPGQEFSLSLPGNPTTGFSWAIESPVPAFLQQTAPENYIHEDHTGAIGASGTYIWRFKAVTTGSAHLRFIYRRPWERGVLPSRCVNFQIISE